MGLRPDLMVGPFFRPLAWLGRWWHAFLDRQRQLETDLLRRLANSVAARLKAQCTVNFVRARRDRLADREEERRGHRRTPLDPKFSCSLHAIGVNRQRLT